jgi:hypothetical protein
VILARREHVVGQKCQPAESLSKGREGLTTTGKAYTFQDGPGTTTFVRAGVSQVAAGTDQNGHAMLDLVLANGDELERITVGSWSKLASGVTPACTECRSGGQMGRDGGESP